MATLSTTALSFAPARRVFLLSLLAISHFSSYASAFNFAAGSECESVCSDETAGTVHDSVRCLDSDFAVAPALHLKECVSCQLNSTAVDPITKMSDVEWALFTLRYTLSNCMFAYPEERVSISSPCQVSCKPLETAVTFAIPNSTNTTDFSGDLGFCTGGQFDDFTVNNCAFCYSFIPQQLILGNFLQALHIACHKAPIVGKAFYPDGVAIFNQSTVAGPAGPDPTPSTGITGTKLILAIVLPVIGGILILAAVCCCCWHFTRRRRAKMAASGRMSGFHDGQTQQYNPMTPNTSPPQHYPWHEPAQEMQTISVMPKMAEPPTIQAPIPKNAPGPAQARWAQHSKDESSTPLTSPNGTSYVRSDDPGAVVGDVKDPNLYEQYVDSENRGSPPVGFHAQDGFVREHTQGGWTH